MGNILEILLQVDPLIMFLIMLLGITLAGTRLLFKMMDARYKSAGELIKEMSTHYHSLHKESRDLRSELTSTIKRLQYLETEVFQLTKKLSVLERTLGNWIVQYPPDQAHIKEMLEYLKHGN